MIAWTSSWWMMDTSSGCGAGERVGESDAGFTVALDWVDCRRSSTREIGESAEVRRTSWEPKSSGRSVTELFDVEKSRGAEDRGITPESRRIFVSSSINLALACWAWFRAASSSLFLLSRASTSSLLRSLEDCAARRLRRTRSTRRCSFSSSVLARFLARSVR